MSIKVMSRVWQVALPAKEKLLLLALADHADPFGGSIFPSVATMSQKTSMPERTVQRMLGSLKKKGVLVVVSPPSNRRPTTYRMTLDGLEDAPPPSPQNCPPALRLEAIEAFGMQCQYCKAFGDEVLGPDGAAWNIDRIIPGSRGGTYAPENITLACTLCNKRKGAKLAPAPEVVTMGAIMDTGGAIPGNSEVTPLAPEPLLEPSIEPSLKRQEENDDFFDAWEDATGQYHAADPRRVPSVG